MSAARLFGGVRVLEFPAPALRARATPFAGAAEVVSAPAQRLAAALAAVLGFPPPAPSSQRVSARAGGAVPPAAAGSAAGSAAAREAEEGDVVGCAAPQIGEARALVAFRLPLALQQGSALALLRAQAAAASSAKRSDVGTDRGMGELDDGDDDAGYPVYAFNPVLRRASGTRVRAPFLEACLSVPGFVGLVWRDVSAAIDYLDECGRPRALAATGFFAALLQHELDHLEGIMFVDRMDADQPLVAVSDASALERLAAQAAPYDGTWEILADGEDQPRQRQQEGE